MASMSSSIYNTCKLIPVGRTVSWTWGLSPFMPMHIIHLSLYYLDNMEPWGFFFACLVYADWQVLDNIQLMHSIFNLCRPLFRNTVHSNFNLYRPLFRNTDLSEVCAGAYWNLTLWYKHLSNSWYVISHMKSSTIRDRLSSTISEVYWNMIRNVTPQNFQL
jgi:hypothetical protein